MLSTSCVNNNIIRIMSSSTQKGNIGTYLLTLTVLAFVFIIGLVAKSMISEGIPAGKYNNPNVSTYVVEGSVYDVNGRSLSLEFPSFDCYFDTSKMNAAQLEMAVETASFYSNISQQDIKNLVNSTLKSYFMVCPNIDANAITEFRETLSKNNLDNCVIIEKSYNRSYPATFHAAQLISEVEKNMSSVISPRPGYNKATTYGNDVYLTIDLDVQYIMDLAVEDLYSVIPSDYVYAFAVNSDDGSIIGMSTYPFFDLNNPTVQDEQKQNKALVSDVQGIEPNFISKIVDNEGNILFTGKDFDTTNLGFTTDIKTTVDSMNNPLTSVVKPAPALERPKYYIVVGVVNPQREVENYVNNTAEYISDALRSQSKI